ncbi:MAG: signal peptidase II [bacterium]|nr:signal peptidase II [bacterium]
MFYIIAAIIIAELIIKREMEEHLDKERLILKDKVLLNKFHNKGIALSYFSKYTKYVKILTTTVIGALLLLLCYLMHKKQSKFFQLGLSMVLGGALSNMIDRYQYGYVVDYFSFNFGKKLKQIVFNLADIIIMAGGAICIIAQLFKKGK